MKSGAVPASQGEMDRVAYKLHSIGAIECDSDNCGKCAVHSAAEMADAKAAANENL